MNSTTSRDLDALIDEARSFVCEVEKVLQKVENQSDKELTELHSTISKKIHGFKKALCCVEEQMMENASNALLATNRYVHESPWQVIAIAGVIGALSTYGLKHLCQRTKK